MPIKQGLQGEVVDAPKKARCHLTLRILFLQMFTPRRGGGEATDGFIGGVILKGGGKKHPGIKEIYD